MTNIKGPKILLKKDFFDTREINNCLTSQNCDGITLQTVITPNGIKISDFPSDVFIQDMKPSAKILNLNIFAPAKVNEAQIAHQLKKLGQLFPIIISSSQFKIVTLENIRMQIIASNGFRGKNDVIVASLDHDENSRWSGDMVLSTNSRYHQDKRELQRLVHHVEDGIPVLVDWPNNYGDRLGRLIEETDGSDLLHIVTSRPEMVQGIVRKRVNLGERT